MKRIFATLLTLHNSPFEKVLFGVKASVNEAFGRYIEHKKSRNMSGIVVKLNQDGYFTSLRLYVEKRSHHLASCYLFLTASCRF